jgi:hypothetical protein
MSGLSGCSGRSASEAEPFRMAGSTNIPHATPSRVERLGRGCDRKHMISSIKQYPGLKDTQREVSELLDSRYSQSAAITIDEKIQLPQGGAEPTDAGVPTIDIANQYDFFADFPQFPINPVAGLNAIFGIIYAHAAYGDGPLPEQIPEIWPDSAPLSDP